jgi:hypothetical protein
MFVNDKTNKKLVALAKKHGTTKREALNFIEMR